MFLAFRGGGGANSKRGAYLKQERMIRLSSLAGNKKNTVCDAQNSECEALL